MRGLITKDQLLTEYNGDIPPWFDPSKLPSLTREQVVWFDETHIEQEGGVISKTGVQVRFPRDINGKYAPNHPAPIYAAKMNKPTFKYASQCRICIGVAAVMLNNGEVEGRKSKVYSYTGKRLVSITEMAEHRKKEIQQIRTIKAGAKSEWISHGRTKEHGYFAEDNISYLPRVGGKDSKTNLQLTELGITTITNIAMLNVATPPPICGITGLILKARDATPGTSPYSSVDC